MAKIDVKETSADEGDPPFPTFVNLRLAQFSKDDGDILLSPRLMTEQEVDNNVDRLIQQLEDARDSAKQILNDSK